MTTGSISSLGIGSGLELQDIIDQLYAIDEAQITAKETEITELETQVDAYNTVNANLFSIKSDALNLSLSSNYLDNSVSVTDEDVISATVGDGYEESSYSIETTQIAKRNSWTSTAVENKNDIMFAEPASGLADHDTTEAISEDTTLTMYYGTYSEISTDSSIAAGTTDSTFAINGFTIGEVTVLDNDSDAALVTAINLLTDDHGVTASVDDDGILTLVSADHSEIEVTMDANTQTVFGGTSDMSNPGQEQIDIDLTSGMTLGEIVDEINNSSDNQDSDGNQLITAAFTLGDDDQYYIKLSAASGGDSADSEISVSDFNWIGADTTVSIAQDGDTMYVSVPPGTSYEEMVDLINDADDNTGLTAAIIDNGDSDTPYQFTLTADDTGEDARITLSTNFTGASEVTGADSASLNSAFTVNGISYTRQSNTAIDDAITGVTLSLKSVGESTLSIEVSNETVKEDLMSMVEGFNSVISYLKGTDADADTEDDTENVFDGLTSANRLVSQLKSLLTTVLDVDNTYTSLMDLGLEISSDGTISIDEDTLDDAIAADSDAVQSLFLGDSDNEITGLADTINDALTNMVSTTGIASTEIDEAEVRIARLDEEIEEDTERLDTKYDLMAASFANLDTYISQLNTQSSLLTSLFEAFSSASE